MKKIVIIVGGLVLLVLFLRNAKNTDYVFLDKEHKYGLEAIDCLLENEKNLSNLSCYNVHVPEVYGDETSRTITFPLRIFRSSNQSSLKNPILHLGAGGPGEAMYLNDPNTLVEIAHDHNGISFSQGRDLLVIDPRGAGLSKPLLNCPEYSHKLFETFQHKQNLEEQFSFMESKYLECIERLKKDNVDFNAYNSEAISNDVEMLRQFLKVDKWILFGVSYSTTYAMHINRKYPKHVEKMILDSTVFPNLKDLRHFLLNDASVFSKLYHYTDVLKEMKINEPVEMNMDIKKRIWNLHAKLNENPIDIGFLDIKIDGNNFINALITAAYGSDIFKKLPKIIVEMENNNVETFSDVFEDYLLFLEDVNYASIASLTHYCYEHKPFIDFHKIDQQISELEKGYMQENAIRTVNMNYFCKEMNITGADTSFSQAIKTDVPTLFIHGKFDSITPLSDVLKQMKGFSNSKLLSYEKSHSVMGNGKVEDAVAKFVASRDDL
jgi:pimeloyl-ACP methyl ester carboxylesterase